MAFERGPYLTAAFLCEKVLSEQDGIKSAIRIFDRTIQARIGHEPPAQMEPFQFSFYIFIKFISGEARGPHELLVTLIRPSGESPPPIIRQQVYFEGEDDRGIDLVGALVQMDVPMAGVYWFRVELDGQLVTKIPWRVIYTPQVIPRPNA